jgi:SAM-dependent methyltransferase
VITVDPAPGMEPDVVAPAEDLPFQDGSFDVVTCRIAAHHFQDIGKAVAEMARVSNRLLVIEDNLYRGEHVEEAERLRDSSHVRCYSEDQWRGFVTDAGFEVEQIQPFARRQSFEAWLQRVDTPPDAAARIRELLADRIEGGQLNLESILLKARSSQK